MGAGVFQKRGIEAAKEMGLYVIAVDGDPKAVGLALADRSYVMNIKDVPALLAVARKEKINGVITIASEVTIPIVARICDALKLPGLSREVAAKCHDKELMRKAFYAHGVPSPKSLAAYSASELAAVAKGFRFPVVIKPSDSAGSRGVRMIQEPGNLESAYNLAVGYSSDRKVLIEEFMEGVEVSVEAFVVRGKVHIIVLSDKIRSDPPVLTDTEITFPSAYDAKTQKKIIAVAKRAIEAVGVQDAPIHLELMMTKDGPVPVELAARGPGFKLFTDIIPTITGIDVVRAAIELALGKKPALKRTKRKASVIRFLDTHDGIVESIRGLDEARRVPDIYEVELYVKHGDKTHRLTSGAERIGHIISIANTRKRALQAVDEAQHALSISVVA